MQRQSTAQLTSSLSSWKIARWHLARTLFSPLACSRTQDLNIACDFQFTIHLSSTINHDVSWIALWRSLVIAEGVLVC